MPKYKLSAEEGAAKQERKEKLRELMSDLEVKDVSDINTLFKEMVGDILENGLESEMDEELGYSKYDYHNKEGSNSRNGHSRKNMKTSFGEVCQLQGHQGFTRQMPSRISTVSCER